MAAVRSLQRIDPQSLVQVFGRRLPVSRTLVIAIILLIAAALGAGVVVSAGSILVANGPTGPFDAYAAIMPGQPISVLEAFTCGSAFPNNSGLAAFYCMVRPEDGPIRSISVSGKNGKIESLTIRTSGIHVGDLIEHWGHPDLIRVFRRSFTLAWDEGIYVIGSLHGRFNYWSPATYVLVMSLED